MSAPITADSLDRRFEKPAHTTNRFPLRGSIDKHPMIMFATVISSAFIAMAFHPTAGSALASMTRSTPSAAMVAELSGKGPRLKPMSEVELACGGQNWGAETETCLEVIARDSGRDTRSVRMIASIAAGEPTTPNVF